MRGNLRDAIYRDVASGVGIYETASSPNQGADFVPTPIADEFIGWIRDNQFCRQLFRSKTMNSKTLDIPRVLGGLKVYLQPTEGGTARTTSLTTDTLTLTAKKLMAKVHLSEEVIDDAAFDMVELVRDDFAAEVAESEEEVFLIGDTDYANVTATEANVNDVVWFQTYDHKLTFDGILQYAAADGGTNVPQVDASSANIALSHIVEALYRLGKYGKRQNDLVLILNSYSASQLLLDSNLITKDKMGEKATLATGVVGRLFGNIDVVNSAYANNPTVASGEGILVLKRNVIIGDRRRIRIRVAEWWDDEIVKVIVSERIAFAWERDAAMCYLFGLSVPADYGS